MQNTRFTGLTNSNIKFCMIRKLFNKLPCRQKQQKLKSNPRIFRVSLWKNIPIKILKMTDHLVLNHRAIQFEKFISSQDGLQFYSDLYWPDSLRHFWFDTCYIRRTFFFICQKQSRDPISSSLRRILKSCLGAPKTIIFDMLGVNYFCCHITKLLDLWCLHQVFSIFGACSKCFRLFPFTS